MVCICSHGACLETYLVMMRGTDKYDRTVTRDVESPAGTNFSEEYLGDYPPENESNILCNCEHVEDGTETSYGGLCVEGHVVGWE